MRCVWWGDELGKTCIAPAKALFIAMPIETLTNHFFNFTPTMSQKLMQHVQCNPGQLMPETNKQCKRSCNMYPHPQTPLLKYKLINISFFWQSEDETWKLFYLWIIDKHLIEIVDVRRILSFDRRSLRYDTLLFFFFFFSQQSNATEPQQSL